jgi:hypothetical protein
VSALVARALQVNEGGNLWHGQQVVQVLEAQGGQAALMELVKRWVLGWVWLLAVPTTGSVLARLPGTQRQRSCAG